MQTAIAAEFAGTAEGQEAEAILRKCVHCGFCTATCPSGVQYGNLVEIGRRIVDERVPRPAGERALRWTLKEGLTSPAFRPSSPTRPAAAARSGCT